MDNFGNYLKWDSVHKDLLSRGLNLFSLRDFQLVFSVDKQTAIKFLSRHKKRGNVKKLKRGLYSLTLNQPSLYLVANQLYQPSYISFETALSFHNLIPEVVYSLTSATPKTTQKFEALGNLFTYYKIKKQAYTGYIPVNTEGVTVFMATPEKAVIDFIYFVSLGKRTYNDRLKIEKLDRSLLEKYAKVFAKPKLLKLLNKPKYDLH